jgi:hypothetical protein
MPFQIEGHFWFLRLFHQDYVGGLQSFWTFLNLELYGLALFQIFKTITGDCRIVNEDIRFAIALDESVSFGGVKPLYSTLNSVAHTSLLRLLKNG